MGSKRWRETVFLGYKRISCLKPGAHRCLRKEMVSVTSPSLFCLFCLKHFFLCLKIEFFCFSLNDNVVTHRPKMYTVQIQPPKDLSFISDYNFTENLVMLELRAHPQSCIVMNKQGQDKQHGWWILLFSNRLERKTLFPPKKIGCQT